jgi:hypothetical protein
MGGWIRRWVNLEWPFERPGADFQLPVVWLSLTILPLAVLLVSGRLLVEYGMLSGGELPISKGADLRLETAGRMRMIITWLLLTAISLAAIGCFAWNLLRFQRESAIVLALVWIAFIVFGLVSLTRGFSGNAEAIIGFEALCRPLALPPREGAACPHDITRYDLLVTANLWQRYILTVSMPALVLGAISCLGGPPVSSAAAVREQAARLRTYLYLTATLFVAGLLFLGALLRWPAFAYEEAALRAYQDHVAAFIQYWGITYTIFIASYYLPIALRTSKQLAKAAETDPRAAEDAADDHLQPFGLVKLAAGVFAPAITGILGGIIAV